jgi:hypothetical protein
MKAFTKTVLWMLIAVLAISIAACSVVSNTDIAETNVSLTVDSADNAVKPEISNTIEPENTIELADTPMEITPIILNMNGTDVHATLNNTVIAKEFKKLLPYSVTVSRATDDLCGSVSEQLNSDNSENSQGWKIGEIGWFGGWFTILVDHEENFRNMSVPIIGYIDEEDIAFVQSLTGQVEIEVRLAEPENGIGDDTMQNTSETQITITVNDTIMTATLADNSSAVALKELLTDGPLTIAMQDYGSMEKVGSIGQNLPTNDEQITTEAGDLILYMGSAFVIYYAPNSWNFTRLGKIDDVKQAELMDILGDGNVTVTLSLE